MLAIVHNPWRVFLCAAACGCLGLVATAPVMGKAPPAKPAPAAGPKNKAYDEIPLGDPDPKEWKLKKTTLMAEGKFPEGAAGQEDEKMLDAHYKRLVSEMTHWNVRDSLHLKWREIKKDLNYFGRAPDKSIHEHLRDMMAKKLLPFVINGPKFYPAARFNALLAYGELNTDEGDIGGNGFVPYGPALPLLMDVLKNKDNKYPQYLQPAALAGVTRHILAPKNSITPENRKELVQVLATTLKQPAAEGLSPDVQNYTRRRASDLLRILARWPEANTPDVVTALNQFAADEDAPLDDRCEAIRTLGVLDKKSYPEKNVPAVARTIALLVADVGRQTQAIEAPAAPAAAEPAADADTPPDAGTESADPPAVAAGEQPAAADGAAGPEAMANADGGDKPAAEAPGAVAENAAADGAAPAAAPVPEAPVVKANSLPPDLQAYLLLCLRCGVSGPPDSQGRGLGSAASADNKQLLTDMVGKVDEMLTVLKRKKREDKLNESEIRKMQDLAAGVEAIVGGAPQDADGTTEQARAK
jgi:hypothetical protein